MQTLMQKIGLDPILCVCICVCVTIYAMLNLDVDVDANADAECEQSLTVVDFTVGQSDDFHIIY